MDTQNTLTRAPHIFYGNRADAIITILCVVVFFFLLLHRNVMNATMTVASDAFKLCLNTFLPFFKNVSLVSHCTTTHLESQRCGRRFGAGQHTSGQQQQAAANAQRYARFVEFCHFFCVALCVGGGGL